MITYVAVLRRKEGTTREAFLDAWLGRHQALARALPDVQRVEFMPSVHVGSVPGEFDGVGILEFRSIEELEASLSSTQAVTLRADTVSFADTAHATRVVVSGKSQAD